MQLPTESIEHTESTFNLSFEEQDRRYNEPGTLFASCQHRWHTAEGNFTTPCYWCVKDDWHHFLRTTALILLDPNTRQSPSCDHRSPGYLLPCSSCTRRVYELYACRVKPLLAQPPQTQRQGSTPPTGFTGYEKIIAAAQKEERIFQRQPTPITW